MWAVLYMFVKGMDFVSFYDFSIEFWNCSDSMIFFFILALYDWLIGYYLEFSEQYVSYL